MKQNGVAIYYLYVRGVILGSLEPFKGALGSCGFFVAIKNTFIASMESLGEIECLEGLQIGSNQKLTHLIGLHNLVHVKGDFRIWGNGALTDVSGPSNLNSVGRKFYIQVNDALNNNFGLLTLPLWKGTLTSRIMMH